MRTSALLAASFLGACGPGATFVSPPPGDLARSWLALDEAGLGRLRIEPANLEAGHIELRPESLVFAFELDSPAGLPRDRRLERSDFGTADCGVLAPSRIWQADLAEPSAWTTAAAPDSLGRILSALAREDCHRCVRFREQAIELDPRTLLIYDMRALSSGARLLSNFDVGLQIVEPSGEYRAVTGCELYAAPLASTVRPNEFFAGNGAEIVHIAIDEANSSCTTLSSTAAPGYLFYFIESWAEGDQVGAFLIADEHLQSAPPTTHRAAFRYAQGQLEHLASFELVGSEETDISPVGPREAIISTGFEKVFHWKNGAMREIILSPRRGIPGLAEPRPGEVLAFSRSASEGASAFRFDAETEEFEVLGAIGERARSAAPFRDGTLIVTRNGEFYEHHEGGFCPLSMQLGNRSNHAPRFVQGGPSDSVVVDLASDRIAWFWPRPPDPPTDLEF